MLLDHPSLNTYRETLITEGDPCYWAAREVALEDIKAVQRLHEEAIRQPTYIDGWDEDGEAILLENDEPWERLAPAKERVARNPNAVAVLEEQGRLELIGGHLDENS